jgi:1-acyl-sn-glycerol-3-phosphate acyltransferase
MQNIVIDKPYVPVPPYHGRIWPMLLTRFVPRMLRKKYGITSVQCIHADRLARSIEAGHGILLTPNHCRDEDPFTLSGLSLAVNSPFFIMASWHLFMQNRLRSFIVRRAGAFSVYREGIDRTAVNTAVQILETAERPLVIFPEGIVSRTNDKLNELLDGTALIARSAAKKRAKLDPPGKVVVHPVALRYKLASDVNAAIAPVLGEIETRLTWRVSDNLPAVDRIFKLGTALLTLKEIEYLGEPRTGDIASRLDNLIDTILVPIENQWLKEKQSGSVPTRVKRLRSAILPDMAAAQIDETERQRRWKQLADLYLAQQLFLFPPDYVRTNPTPERLLETAERFEEDLTDVVKVHGDLHATITVGEPIEVSPARESRGSEDPLMENIRKHLQLLLEIPTTSPSSV